MRDGETCYWAGGTCLVCTLFTLRFIPLYVVWTTEARNYACCLSAHCAKALQLRVGHAKRVFPVTLHVFLHPLVLHFPVHINTTVCRASWLWSMCDSAWCGVIPVQYTAHSGITLLDFHIRVNWLSLFLLAIVGSSEVFCQLTGARGKVIFVFLWLWPDTLSLICVVYHISVPFVQMMLNVLYELILFF